jgi:hypothetical protein
LFAYAKLLAAALAAADVAFFGRRHNMKNTQRKFIVTNLIDTFGDVDKSKLRLAKPANGTPQKQIKDSDLNLK